VQSQPLKCHRTKGKRGLVAAVKPSSSIHAHTAGLAIYRGINEGDGNDEIVDIDMKEAQTPSPTLDIPTRLHHPTPCAHC